MVRRLAKVTEAQLVIARELGVPSWPRLREHLTRLALARAAVAAGAPTLDGELPTTHVRCGSDIRESLRHAGLTGEFVEFVDPVCQGPVPAGADLLEVRARFLASAYDLDLAFARGDLSRQLAALTRTIDRPRVVLWFEHDTFDQLILARVLAFYAERGGPGRLELVQVDRFPGVDRFRGLGELSAAALRTLWDDRQPVTAAQLGIGAGVWKALREPSPMGLFEAAHACEALPAMGPALRRHLEELPWLHGGLSRTERATLELLSEGPMPIGELFLRVCNDRESAVHLGLGDSMFYSIVERMRAAQSPPLLVGERGERPAPRSIATITPPGRALLAGTLDFRDAGPVERWAGGVRIAADAPDWRWDPSAGRPVLRI